MKHFFDNIHFVADVDEIKRLHDTTLLSIIDDLFLKNSFVSFFFKKLLIKLSNLFNFFLEYKSFK